MKITTTIIVRVESDAGGKATAWEDTETRSIGGNPRFVAHEVEQQLLEHTDGMKTRIEAEFGVRP